MLVCPDARSLLNNHEKAQSRVVFLDVHELGTCQKLAGGRGGGILELSAENIVPLP